MVFDALSLALQSPQSTNDEVEGHIAEYRDITGGSWVMGTSFHSADGLFTVTIQNPDHPGVVGISDFPTKDELYEWGKADLYAHRHFSLGWTWI